MSETIKDRRVFSLLEVMKSVQKTLADRYKSSFWVKAEMNKLNFYRQSGHCYPDLVEKQDGKNVAQVRAMLWKDDYRRIDDLFRRTLNEPLKDGIKILFLAKIFFDPSHALTLHIMDIDPDYTLGDLEKDKQETIRKLKEEGIFDRNKLLKLPLLPQRIAIISVETSKGYKDFLGKIDRNAWGYRFFYFLFPSLLQGEKIIRSISAQLNRIRKVIHHFDAVAIIRGGGGEIGLSAYNNYLLAKQIALFPLPVLTGIGHITNETVVEMVAYRNLITPTDLADFFIQQFHNFSMPLRNMEQKLIALSDRMISRERLKFQAEMKLFRSVTESVLFHNRNRIDQLYEKLSDKSQLLIREQIMWLDSMEKDVNSLNPEEIMKRGYSITLHRGKAVKSIAQLNAGDTLNTLVFGGNIISTVQTIHLKTEESEPDTEGA
ncbi:MAG: exodeoxyribonuclease VII large subunit [Tannerella sp.]|jgi:exodeoxyribonuclease VII large subunit|nr:exodeoxyribonuclease VII large subunit [Tannerella sp.]